MATVRSLALAGKTVNVPHTEHREADPDAGEKNSVTFGEDGTAEVSNRLAEALIQFYPSQIEVTKLDKEKAAPAPKRETPKQVAVTER